jgi:aminoglycoside 3-N-acetyltransferase I
LDSTVRTARLASGDTALATRMFALMAAVFGEPEVELSDAYVAGLLSRPSFWAIVAIEGDEIVGGLTAHTLPMTRVQGSEIFIYDIAVRTDRQRRGVGRSLVMHLRKAAAAEGIDVVFVPADVEDAHALEFYRALGGDASPVTFFTFER